MYYDIHTHIINKETGCDIRAVLNKYPQDFVSAKREFSNSYFSCGIHPWNAEDAGNQIGLLEEIAKEDRVVAIGEVGLDKLRGPSMDVQVATFDMQIELAEKVQKPLIIHCVKAWDELISLYKKRNTSSPWILHGYRGNAEQTKQLSRLGFKFSIGEKFNPESVKHIPLDSLFCETDDSGISICHIYNTVSDVFGVEKEHFVFLITENIRKNMNLLSK